VSAGYTTISNVRNPIDTRPKDMMESFFLGETLKYFYLLFADSHEIDLDKWVFNPEAHLMPIYDN
jgi:mannosyl-oligosaccharide alpha-1,2-mannosidase